jgi:hypothetical protein
VELDIDRDAIGRAVAAGIVGIVVAGPSDEVDGAGREIGRGEDVVELKEALRPVVVVMGLRELRVGTVDLVKDRGRAVRQMVGGVGPHIVEVV